MLDPTIELCRVKNSFHQAPIIVEDMEQIVSYLELELHSFQLGVVPYFLSQLSTDITSVYSDVNDNFWSNRIYNLSNSIFSDRDGVKMANLDILFNITGHQGGNLVYQNDKSFTYCDIGGSPGGYVQYLQFRIPRSFGYGLGKNWDMKNIAQDTFNYLVGDDRTGSILTNYKWFADYISDHIGRTLNLVMANQSSGDNYSLEEDMAPIIAAETIVAMTLLNSDGTFLLRIYDSITSLTIELLYIIACCFENISIIRPMSTTGERYVIARNINLDTTRLYLPHLQKYMDAYLSGEKITHIIDPKDMSDLFIAYMLDVNNFDRTQRSPTQDTDIYNINRALLYWNIPGNIQPNNSL